MHNIFEIEIEKLIFGGSGLGRHRGKVVFVPYSAPGDRLTVRAVREKKNYIRGDIVEILRPGPGRISPACPHFGKCGGCHWQHLEYTSQVGIKQALLREAFHHHFPYTRDLTIAMEACPQPFAYRSRARVQVRRQGSGLTSGFFRPESHTVEPVKHCPLLREPLNQALSSLNRTMPDRKLGTLVREMDIACSCEDNLWVSAPAGDENSVTTPRLQKKNGENTPEIRLKRKVGDFHYNVTATVFFQANDFMVSPLVGLVREMAEQAGGLRALDLFSGVGLFSLPLAGLFESVVAVESSPQACRLCSENALEAGIDRIQTVCAEVSRWLEPEEPGGSSACDLVLLDPPRSGAGNRTMERIVSRKPETILYVSCDPQTLIRDLSRISPKFYRIDRIEGLDMFPQTYHFETVVGLVRR